MNSLFNFPKLITALVILFVIFVPLEKLFALRPKKIFRKGWVTDLAHFLINDGLRTIAVGLTFLALTYLISFIVHPGLQAWIKTWPFWVQSISAIVLNDIGGYWGHRWAHMVPWL